VRCASSVFGFIDQSMITDSTLPAISSTSFAKPPTKRRKRRISPAVIHALELWATGRAKNKTEAATMASITPEWFGKMLKRPETGVLVEQMTRRLFAEGQIRATARMMDLMDSSSSKVSFEASRFVLAVNKIAPPRDGGNVVNFNLGGAGDGPGFIIELVRPDDEVMEGHIGPAGGVIVGRKLTDHERQHGVAEQRHPVVDVTPTRSNEDEQ
jgi:hypothetical protein